MSASPIETVRARRRKTWACAECHRRKVQCDRSRPSCKRCSKAGRASECYYTSPEEIANDSRSLVGASTPPIDFDGTIQTDPKHLSQAISDDSKSISVLERRIQILESILKSNTSQDNHPYYIAPQQTSHYVESEFFVSKRKVGNSMTYRHPSKLTTCRGSSFKTQFRGPTFSGNVAERILDLNTFTKDAFQMATVLEQIRQAGNQSQFSLGLLVSPEPSIETLSYLLPAREEVDRLVDIYLDNIDHVYHVIHWPSFSSDYQGLWHDGIGPKAQTVILTLLIVAIAYCSTETDDNRPEPCSGITRDRARNILDACEAWLQSRIPKLESMHDFQIHFLLLLGRQLSAKRYKQTWVNAGKLIRIWMCCGLNREPRALSADTTPRDKEFRKRLWASAAEFELQASFEHGMCAHSWPLQSDIGPPSNISDADLDDVSRAPPVHAYTSASYLALSSESLHFRHQLNTILNTVNQALTFDQMKSYADKLLSYVQAIPIWTGRHPTTMHVLLCLGLQQYLLALYEQQLSCTTSQTEKQFLQTALFETAFRMVRCHSVALDTGSRVVEVLSTDHLRVALSLCRSYMSTDSLRDDMLMSFKRDALDILEELVKLACHRVKHFGGDRRHYWLICAAAGLLQSKEDPAGRAKHIRKAVNRFAEPYESLLEDMARQPNLLTAPSSDTLVYQPQDDLVNWALEDWSLNLTGP